MADYIKNLANRPTIAQFEKLQSNFEGVCLRDGEIKGKPYGISVEITPEQSLIAIGMALDELGIN